MKKYILTGTPGSGKTVLIRYLESIGHYVIEEAATDLIYLAQTSGETKPWTKPEFIEKVVQLQIQRRTMSDTASTTLQFFDRSPFCTLALARYLEFSPPQILLDEIDFLKEKSVYQRNVFFIENLGYCQPSEARKISFEEALRFEKMHEKIYLEHGFELIKIPRCPVNKRVHLILSKTGCT